MVPSDLLSQSKFYYNERCLPRVDETLDTLAGSQWFTTLDLLSGYWQVQLNEADREKTAFTTHQGLFEFKRMPQMHQQLFSDS